MFDVVIVAAYFIAVLIFGLVYGRKVESVFDFSIARTQFPTSVLAATFFATIIGGASTIGAAEKFFSIGIIFGFVNLAACLRDLFTAQVIVPRMISLKNAISLGDIIEPYYGRYARVICGLAGLLKCVGYVGIQVSATGYVMHYFGGLSHDLGVFLAAGIVIAYSAFGGIRSVTITDVIQFGVLICAIPICFSASLISHGGMNNLFDHVPAQNFSLWPDDGLGIKIISMAIIFLLPNLDPALLQRFMMGRDFSQVRRALTISSICCVPYYFMVGTIGLSVLVKAPDSNSSTAFFYVIDKFLPLGLRGLAISGVLAVVMSTADSYLNVASITAVRDVIKPIIKKDIGDALELRLMRLMTVLFGIFSIAMALYIPSVYELALFALSFWGPVVFVPLLLSLLGKKADKATFFVSAVLGIVVFVVWRVTLQDITGIEAILPATITNAAVFWLSSLRRIPTWLTHFVRRIFGQAFLRTER